MRIAFAGTPEFAAVTLRALLEAGHEIALVFTQPDRRSGRGMKFLSSPVKDLAYTHGVPVYQPASLKSPEAQTLLAAAAVKVMIVAAYGLILPTAVLHLPTHGCLNIHASLLPRWRGAAPIQRAILAGDKETGVCIMQMELGLDTGPVLLSSPVSITPTDTGVSLHDKLARLGAGLIVEALAKLAQGLLSAVPQSAEGVTYADKLFKDEAEIDWSQAALAIERQVRAFNPFPVARSRLRGEPLRIWRVRLESGLAMAPGSVIRANGNGIVVGCGGGALAITELQKSGGKRLTAAAFLAGNLLEPGEVLR